MAVQPRRHSRGKTQELPEFTLSELFCLLSAWSGQSIEQVRKWKIPVFMKMYKTYTKEMQLQMQLNRIRLGGK